MVGRGQLKAGGHRHQVKFCVSPLRSNLRLFVLLAGRGSDRSAEHNKEALDAAASSVE